MTPTQTMTPPPLAADGGRGLAMLVYGLYLLSIPSAGILALIGVIVALCSRDDTGPMPRTHIGYQIRIWFVSFWWHIGLFVMAMFGFVLTVVLIGFPILWLVALGWLILQIWFTVVSFLGLLALLDGRPR